MIWPFKRDPLESNADLLVGAANTLGVGTFVPVIDEFQFVPQDDMGQKYWDLVVTIAGVFIALMGLRNLSLNTTPLETRKESRRVFNADVSRNSKTGI